MVFELSAAELGLTPENYPHRVWGIVLETGVESAYYTLVVLANGTTSLYFSNGGGIIGAGEHSNVRETSTNFLAWANKSIESTSPTSTFQPPDNGNTVFYFLTFDGIQSYASREIELGEGRDPLSSLFHAGHAVIAAMRETQSQ